MNDSQRTNGSKKTGDSAFDPPNPLKKGASELKVLLFKGDLGGSKVSGSITDTHMDTAA